jgi:predicted metal-dependent enzyme (double-stranded beta helix superfamily)
MRDARTMLDVESLIEDCIAANAEAEPVLAVRDVLGRALADPAGVAAALPPVRAGITRLHVSPTLTVIGVVWAPGMSLWPHDHRMWAAIGIYSGGEDNAFYRRAGRELTESGGRELRPKDICLLGDDVVHAVHNPTTEFAGAIHVYGGDFFTVARSEWSGTPYREQPYDVEHTLAQFEAANAAVPE